MSDPQQHKVGDVVNGHRLTDTPEGMQWLPVEGAPVVDPGSTPTPRPWYKRKAIVIPAACVLGLVIFVGAIGNANRKTEPVADSKPAAVQEAPAEEPAEPEKFTMLDVSGMTAAEATAILEADGLKVVPGTDPTWIVSATSPSVGGIVEPGAEVTLTATAPLSLEQENALKQAQSYLDLTSFSRQGLIDQMSSEHGSGYPLEVATWAVDQIGADWNAEAAEAAKSYLELTAFSRDDLYQQLTSEHGSAFTPEQAEFGLKAVGY